MASLSTLCWNIRKQWNKLKSDPHAHELFNANDIVALTETGGTSTNVMDRELPGYAHYHCTRPDRRGGGVSIFVRHGLHKYVTQIIDPVLDGAVDIVWLRISCNCLLTGKDILIGGVYIPPEDGTV